MKSTMCRIFRSIWAPRITSVALGAALFLVASSPDLIGMARANSSLMACPEIARWVRITEASAGPQRTLAERNILAQQEWDARNSAALEVYRQYMEGALDDARWSACLEGKEGRQNFLNTLYRVFFEQSMQRLRQASVPSLREFVSLVDQRSRSGRVQLFKLTGHFRELSPASLKAGFHRGSGSIYIDFSRVPPEEWLAIFIHEMLHGLDARILISTRYYSDVSRVQLIADWAHEVEGLELLPADARAELRQWLHAGLDRGLWAEYRAWLATFVIYRDGLAEGLWPRIDWIERILGAKPAGLSLDRYVYDYLDARFTDPADGIFSLPMVRSALEELRQEYRGTGGRLPEMGNMGSILSK